MTFTGFKIEGYIKDQTFLYAAVDLSVNNVNYGIKDVKKHIETKFNPEEPSSSNDPIIELSGSVITELSGVFIKQLDELPGGEFQPEFQPSDFDIKIEPFLKKLDGSSNEGLGYELHILPFFRSSGNFTYPGNITKIPFISPDFSGPIITITQEPTLNSETKSVEIHLKVDEKTPEIYIACFPTSMNKLGPSNPATWIEDTTVIIPKVGQVPSWKYLFEVQDGSGIGGAAVGAPVNQVMIFDISGLYIYSWE
jgi:hypothetical protein